MSLLYDTTWDDDNHKEERFLTLGLATRGENPSIHVMVRQTPRGIIQHSDHL